MSAVNISKTKLIQKSINKTSQSYHQLISLSHILMESRTKIHTNNETAVNYIYAVLGDCLYRPTPVKLGIIWIQLTDLIYI